MPATALTETYVACIASTFTLGASPNTSVLKIIDGGYTISFGVDEMTNNGSGGAYEDVKTYKSVEGSFTGAFESGTPPVFNAGDIFPIVINNANGPYLSCNARFNQVEMPVLDVKAGLKYKFTIKSQGAIVVVDPS